ncbi:polysaccharide deacetylase [Neorhizobium lilium]|uniref:Polysaccharide deacetylase n=1 Tax=Neorhizobium lilium TaxID=2503024 RepID=A0A3S3RSZ2_9HYPH|nr:polysaccharide deacetylase family protein [Neorhizobium lilium]RWX77261.1 polysaccharide deacetylase [Neorhizobium lilium]
MSLDMLKQTLERLQASGHGVRFWLRDDDAVEPTPALERLLALTAIHDVPLTLAIIPEGTGAALAEALRGGDDVLVAVHGWSHANHAGPREKKQELGSHRPLDETLQELAKGFDKLSGLYPQQFIPMLVPPWNRIAPSVVEALPSLGFRALSVFGAEQPGALPLLNTHVDIMNWHGIRGGRDPAELFRDLAELLEAPERPVAIGILTHHLVHDENAWRFLEELFEATADHPACTWISAREALDL